MEAAWIRTEPEGLGLWPDEFALFALEERFEVTEEVGGVGGGCLVLDVVGSVVVHAVEIVGALHERELFGREGGEAVPELRDHGCGVVAVVDGVCEPGDAEFEFALRGFDVERVGGVPGVDAVAWMDSLLVFRVRGGKEDVPFKVIPICPPFLGLNSSL